MDRPSPTPAGADDRFPYPILSLRELYPDADRSLSFISAVSFGLGAVCALAAVSVTTSLARLPNLSGLFTSSTIVDTFATLLPWRIGAFVGAVALFHFLEFWTHAHRNVPNARTGAFLFNNGHRYTIAYCLAVVEAAVWNRYSTTLQSIPFLSSLRTDAAVLTGLVLVLLGQTVRSTAILHAGTNFNHAMQLIRRRDHKLVTTGVYSHLRHPSYFGFFWWAVGTQIMIGNPVSLAVYAAVLSHFFRTRIRSEEFTLVGFFGNEYVRYRDHTWVGIPFLGSPRR